MARWRERFSGMSVSEAKEKRRLEEEKAKLKRLVAQFAMEVDSLKAALGKKVVITSVRREPPGLPPLCLGAMCNVLLAIVLVREWRDGPKSIIQGSVDRLRGSDQGLN